VRTAAAEADARRRQAVGPFYLFAGILSEPSGPGARVLAEVGTSEARVRELLDAL
jgi:hypothetical protein